MLRLIIQEEVACEDAYPEIFYEVPEPENDVTDYYPTSIVPTMINPSVCYYATFGAVSVDCDPHSEDDGKFSLNPFKTYT